MGQSSHPTYPENIFQQISTSVGGDHACGILLDDGDIRCWGNNGRSQSDNQDGTLTTYFVLNGETMCSSFLLFKKFGLCMRVGTFVQVSAGTRTTCAIRVEADSSVKGDDSNSSSTAIHCWGNRTL